MDEEKKDLLIFLRSFRKSLIEMSSILKLRVMKVAAVDNIYIYRTAKPFEQSYVQMLLAECREEKLSAGQDNISLTAEIVSPAIGNVLSQEEILASADNGAVAGMSKTYSDGHSHSNPNVETNIMVSEQNNPSMFVPKVSAPLVEQPPVKTDILPFLLSASSEGRVKTNINVLKDIA